MDWYIQCHTWYVQVNCANMQVFEGNIMMLSCEIWSRLPMGRIRSMARETLMSHALACH